MWSTILTTVGNNFFYSCIEQVICNIRSAHKSIRYKLGNYRAKCAKSKYFYVLFSFTPNLKYK